MLWLIAVGGFFRAGDGGVFIYIGTFSKSLDSGGRLCCLRAQIAVPTYQPSSTSYGIGGICVGN